MAQYSPTRSRLAEKGVRGVLIVRLVAEYVVFCAVPGVCLALVVRKGAVEGEGLAGTEGGGREETCFIAFDRAWLLFSMLWPVMWSLGVLVYLVRYWGEMECVRTSVPGGVGGVVQAARDMRLMLGEKDMLNVCDIPRRWRYGYRIRGNDEESWAEVEIEAEKTAYLGLVREDECLSITDWLVGMEKDIV